VGVIVYAATRLGRRKGEDLTGAGEGT